MIQVIVPEVGTVILNPYKLNAVLDGVDSTEQILSSTMVLTNYSRVAVQVNATAFGMVTGGSGLTFVSAPPEEDTPEKELFTYLEFERSEDGSAPSFWDSQYRNAPNQLLVTEAGSGKEDLLTLDAGNEDPAYGVFRVFGSASTSPVKPWTGEDQILITVAFTFTALQ